MTEETAEDYVVVKKTYPEALLKVEKTYGRAEEFTVFDPDSGKYVGPTAFSRDTAWRHAAERLRRAEQ